MTDPKKIAFAGDWHANTYWAVGAINAAARCGAEAIVHTGDFGFNFKDDYLVAIGKALAETNTLLYFVDGNHDNHYTLKDWLPVEGTPFKVSPNSVWPGHKGVERLMYIPRGARWTWWGKTFMGLGGAHSVDRPWRTPMVSWWDTELITQGDVYRAIEGGPVDVMVTHDIPACSPMPNDRKSAGAPFPPEELVTAEQNRKMLQHVVDAVKPKLLVHGHMHQRHDKQIGELHVVGLDCDGRWLINNLWFTDASLKEIDMYSGTLK